MQSRRNFVRLALLALLAPAATARPQPRPQASQPAVWLPIARSGGDAPPGDSLPADLPLLGASLGTAEQAASWLNARCAAEYSPSDVAAIVDTYRRLGEWAGLDWFLAIGQMIHETGAMSSWWSGRPRRNPAGIAVTGTTRAGAPDAPPGPGWTWDDRSMFWREGWSFPTWADHGIPAHLGRLLAYALTDAQASPAQRDLIGYALSYRGMPSRYRGSAPTIVGLNGKWAVPGTTYGQRIIELVWAMRKA
jgi:hypothetical protein